MTEAPTPTSNQQWSDAVYASNSRIKMNNLVIGATSKLGHINLRNSCVKFARNLSGKKKFYKTASICQANGGFELNLDQRKLRTPQGNILQIPTEGLAHMVALEWNSQPLQMNTHQLPITSLCFKACDNPEERTANVIALSSLKFLHTDTVLFHMEEPEDLAQLQAEKWGGIVSWLNEFYGVSVHHTTGFGKPHIDDNTINVLNRHLQSFNLWSLIAFENMVNVLKSVILSLGIVDRHLSCEEAVDLALLEQKFQISKWGNVEWHHDVELYETQMKTAASASFIQLCNEDSRTISIKDFRKSPSKITYV